MHLGSLIPSINRPNQDTYGPVRRLREGVDYKWRDEKNPEFKLEEEGKGSIKADLTKILRVWGEKSNSQSTALTATEGRIYELVNPKKLFNSLIVGKPCRDWLNQAHDEGEDPHFLVGYRTYFDASKKDEVTNDTKAGGSAEVPAGEAAGDPAAAVPSGSTLNPRVEGELSKHTHKEGSSDLPGERIFAMCLRRVRFDWFKSKDGNPARLEKHNCWVVTSFRGADGPDAVEVDLEDSFGEDCTLMAVINAMDTADEFVAVDMEMEDD